MPPRTTCRCCWASPAVSAPPSRQTAAPLRQQGQRQARQMRPWRRPRRVPAPLLVRPPRWRPPPPSCATPAPGSGPTRRWWRPRPARRPARPPAVMPCLSWRRWGPGLQCPPHSGPAPSLLLCPWPALHTAPCCSQPQHAFTPGRSRPPQVLVATAVRLMHAASLAAQDSATGVATPASTRAYNLLRTAAGMLEFAAREMLPSLPAGSAADLDPQVRLKGEGCAWRPAAGGRVGLEGCVFACLLHWSAAARRGDGC